MKLEDCVASRYGRFRRTAWKDYKINLVVKKGKFRFCYKLNTIGDYTLRPEDVVANDWVLITYTGTQNVRTKNKGGIGNEWFKLDLFKC
jgi:hypothetical protein